MAELMRPQDALRSLRGGDPLAPTLSRRVGKAVDRESACALADAARAQRVGYVTATRIDAVELVTERTMFSLDRLHKVEAAMTKDDPIKAAQYAALVDDFLMIARCELREMTREF